MAKVLRIGMEPWCEQTRSEAEMVQTIYDRLVRKYKGLDRNIIRAAWRRYLSAEPTDEIVDGIRTGRRLQFR